MVEAKKLEIVLREPAFLEYTDGIIAYHQYRDELELSASEARNFPDTLEVFADVYETVEANPEIALAFTGVIRCRGQNRQDAIATVRAAETEILNSLWDIGAISDSKYRSEKQALAEDTEVRKRAEQFVRLFRAAIPADQLPKPRKRRTSRSKPVKTSEPRVAPADIQPPDDGTVIDLSVEREKRNVGRETAQPKPQRKKSKQQEFRDAFADKDHTDPLDVARRVGNGAANYILDGEYTGDVSVQDMKSVLRVLAGHPLLAEDRFVLKRYMKMQKVVASAGQDPMRGLPEKPVHYFIESLQKDKPVWHEQAVCIDETDVDFYPGRGESTKEAKAVCASCPVRDECLEYALTQNEKFGIWGGMSERQRRVVRRVRALGEATPEEIQALIAGLRGDSTPGPEEDPLEEFDDVFEAERSAS